MQRIKNIEKREHDRIGWNGGDMVLTLPIKKKWFDMIASGVKKEEYRGLTPYYESRLGKHLDGNGFRIVLRNGYKKDSPKLSCFVSLRIGNGRPEWGAEPGKVYFILKIYDSSRIWGC